MKKQLFKFLLLLSFAAGVSAQKLPTGDVTEQNLRKHVEYLASDKLEGRRTGERGATFAAGYIANAFARYKLKPSPLASKGKPNFLQPFPYVTGVELAATGNEFNLQFPAGTVAAVKASVKPVGFSPNGEIAGAKIIFPAYGIVSSEPVFDDYGDNDVKGKVVMVFDGNPDNDNPHSPFARFDVRAKAQIAKSKGAVGLLLISREDNLDDDKLTRLEYDQTLGEAALPTFVISRDTAASVLAVKAADLVFIESMLIAMRKVTAARKTITLRDAVPTIGFRVNLVKKQSEAYNVIGVLGGTDPVLKNEAVVIGAHYDHLGRGGQGSLDVNSTEIHHGADDNASGTSVILELARQFAERKNKRTIIFIAFSGEEEGLLGSNFYVNNPVFPIDKTVAMINLDMVGRLKDNKLTIGGIGTASDWKNTVESRNLSENVGVLIAKMPDHLRSPTPKTESATRFDLSLNEDGFGPSDHSSFYGKKIPVLFLFTGTHENYHKPSDTADKINYEGLMKITRFVGEIIKSIDQNPLKPTYTVAKSSGTMGRTGFNVSLGTVPNYADSTDGLVLDGVRENSPAAKAGIKAGDKIVGLAGKDVRNVSDYTFILGEMKAGQEYEVVLLRASERLTLKIIPAAAAKR